MSSILIFYSIYPNQESLSEVSLPGLTSTSSRGSQQCDWANNHPSGGGLSSQDICCLQDLPQRVSGWGQQVSSGVQILCTMLRWIISGSGKCVQPGCLNFGQGCSTVFSSSWSSLRLGRHECVLKSLSCNSSQGWESCAVLSEDTSHNLTLSAQT